MSLSEPLQQVDRTCVLYRGRKLIYFGGCDYFRLSSHPMVLDAVRSGLDDFGLNVAASRKTTGNHALFARLEDAVAKFFGAEAALLAASGYVTNLIVAQALAGKFTHAFMDERSHGSLRDAAQFLCCPVSEFQHRDSAHLKAVMQQMAPRAKVLVLTDGMFSHDGSMAPLSEYLRVLPTSACLIVDDAHGAGVLGRTGKGTVEECGVGRERIIQTISLSKAFGAYGGVVLCDAKLRSEMIDRSRLFNGNTPVPLPLAQAALAGARILRADKALRGRLNANADYVKSALRDGGLAVPHHPAPIVQVIPRDARQAGRLTRRLLKHGVFPSLIRYVADPPQGYFRFMISSEHTGEQLDALVAGLIEH